MWGSVEVDSDAMGSVRVCGMHTTISRRVRYITINHGVRKVYNINHWYRLSIYIDILSTRLDLIKTMRCTYYKSVIKLRIPV